MGKELELLMPGGSLEKIKYAIAYGADAVFAGVPKYSLRARENEFFDIEKIKEAIRYVHSKGKKIYLTTNIYAHNNKINGFIDAMKQMVDCQPDAFIMTDPGLIMLTREMFPDVEIHLSTQANNTNWAQAKFWYEHGVKRVILARELKVKEIREIHEKVPELELEAFVHGSICMAYSGRCLLSNYLNYRDANQGTCSHTCRWGFNLKVNDIESIQGIDPKTQIGKPVPNDDVQTNYIPLAGEFFLEEKERPGEMMPVDEDEYGTYIMNSKDLCAVDYIKDLKEAGIISFKVEGRNKTEYYAGIVARAYKKALDLLEAGEEVDAATRNWMLGELASTANRGFIPGFYAQSPAAAAQEFEKDSAFQTHLYAGKIVSFDADKQVVELEVKNRLDRGDKIEFLSPEASLYHELSDIFYESYPPQEYFDKRNELLAEAHAANSAAIAGGSTVIARSEATWQSTEDIDMSLVDLMNEMRVRPMPKFTEHAHGGGKNVFIKVSKEISELLAKDNNWETAITRMPFKEPVSLKQRTPVAA